MIVATALPAAKSPLAANLICMLSMLIWAAGLPANSYLIPILPPLVLSALRMAVAAAALLPFWLWLEGSQALRGADWVKGVGVGAMIGMGGLLLILGQARTDAVTVAVISAAMPIIGVTLEVVLDGRKLTVALVLGLILAVVGGVVALGAGIGAVDFGTGALMILASTICFAIGSRLTVTAFPALTPLGRTAITLVGAAVASLAVAAVAIIFGLSAPPDFALMGGREWAALGIFAVGSLALSQMLWIIAVGQLGIGLAALHINATPFYVMLILLALGGAWNWPQAIGAAIVGLAVLVAQDLLRRRA